MKRLILASGSKRRYDILKNAGYEFDVIIPGVDEDSVVESSPQELVLKLSKLKALAVLESIKLNGFMHRGCEDSVILASDTVVALDSIILGKPKDKDDARATLELLSGRTHSVYTGVCIIDSVSHDEVSFYEKCIVHMSTINPSQIREYIETGLSMDKAGSYGIQGPGALFVSSIEGDFFTVCGLPVNRVYGSLSKFGILPKMGNVEYI